MYFNYFDFEKKKKLLSSRANELFLERLTSLYSLIFKSKEMDNLWLCTCVYIPFKLYPTTNFELIA